MKPLVCSLSLFLLAFTAFARQEKFLTLEEMVSKDAQGNYVVAPPPMEERFKNPPLPAEWEKGFRDRVNHIIKVACEKPATGVNTYFENEKRTYGLVMMQVLGGYADAGMKILQTEDVQKDEWHRETRGIDYYACFTLKHQMRKYFYFGGLLSPEYRERMFEGAKLWTAQDPLHRPHYAADPAKKGQGWGPDAMNSWVDVRSTDNLFLMRTTSVYLMAEETGNEQTRLLYKDRFATFVKDVYRIGNGEWDSENYLGHSIAPVYNLYDFAKDPEVKLLAKALLDWFYTASALKYFHGGYNGPSKRDYTHIQPFGGSISVADWAYFGDCPWMNSRLESDEIHLITSNYRPPAAVVNLALKKFEKPREIFAAKPEFEAPQKGYLSKPPAFHETQYIGNTFQLGTLAEGMTDKGDESAFRAVAVDSVRGLIDIQCAPYLEPDKAGSPRYTGGLVTGPNRTAQYRSSGIWLIKNPQSPWMWVLPSKVAVEQEQGVTFLKAEKTWFALRPVNTGPIAVDDALTAKMRPGKEDSGSGPSWAEYRALSSKGTGTGAFCGFVMEAGDAQSHGDYAAFKKKILASSKLVSTDLNAGTIEYQAASGEKLGMEFGDAFAGYKVTRDGIPHDWVKDHQFSYFEAGKAGGGLVHQDWNGNGTLRVEAGGKLFTCTVGADGKVTFENR